jgi:hypothetical protein
MAQEGEGLEWANAAVVDLEMKMAVATLGLAVVARVAVATVMVAKVKAARVEAAVPEAFRPGLLVDATEGALKEVVDAKGET